MVSTFRSTVTGQVNAMEPETAGERRDDAARGRHFWLTGLAVLAVLVIFGPTLLSMAAIWWRSDTFIHGVFVFPISLFLIWRKREELRTVAVGTDFRALLPLACLGMGWFFANLVDVLVVEQLALVLMIPTVVWLLLGFGALRVLVFPLLFLLFAVPVGEALIYPLMKFTAAFTVQALRLTGMPVYWDGTFFSIPSGNWSVVEGCSGVRYLIASVFLGVLYAYMFYHTLWRRLLFVALAIVVPIFANGVRAYMIVMIAHLSDHKLALGVDHFIYGWVWFGIVMFLLFWVGTLWREPHADTERKSPNSVGIQSAVPPRTPSYPWRALLAGLLLLSVWPVWSAIVSNFRAEATSVVLEAPPADGVWKKQHTLFTQWKPRYLNPSAELLQAYSSGDTQVGLYLAFYGVQEQGAELINSQNVMVTIRHPVWRMPTQAPHAVRVNGEELEIIESPIKSDKQDLLAWRWYWVADHHTSNPYETKIRQALEKLLNRPPRGAGIVMFTPMSEGVEQARAVLQQYLDDMLPAVEAALRSASRE